MIDPDPYNNIYTYKIHCNKYINPVLTGRGYEYVDNQWITGYRELI